MMGNFNLDKNLIHLQTAEFIQQYNDDGSCMWCFLAEHDGWKNESAFGKLLQRRGLALRFCNISSPTQKRWKTKGSGRRKGSTDPAFLKFYTVIMETMLLSETWQILNSCKILLFVKFMGTLDFFLQDVNKNRVVVFNARFVVLNLDWLTE